MSYLRIPYNRMIALLLSLALLLGGVVYLPAAAYEAKQGTVTGVSSLNVRSGPGKEYESVGFLQEGDTVTIVGEATASDGKTWYQIEYQGATAYIGSTYIVVTQPETPPETEPDTPPETEPDTPPATEPDTPPATQTEAEFEASMAAFPESYQDDLREIHALYPNWIFVAVPTGTTWAEALEAECVLGRSTVASTSISSWKSTQTGAYNWDTSTWVGLDGASWVQASEAITAYYMDPRSYLDENYIFTFLDYGSYDPQQQTVEGLKRMVSGTFMEKDFTEGETTYSYPDVLMQTAEQTGMNPYVLASMIRIEIGSKGTSGSISGTVSGYEGYYNYYNIGAYAANGMSAIQRGLWYAKGGNSGATSYNRPWNSRTKAILGGAMFFKESYVDKGQDTIYLKKFNVVKGGGYDLYTHQYMTNVNGASLEGKTLSQAFDEQSRQQTLVFRIPVFENMPAEEPVQPTGDGSPNNKLADLSVEGYSLTPAFQTDTLSYDLVLDAGVSTVTINAAAKDSSATVSGTGEITLSDGANLCQIVVTAQNGQTRTYEIEIAASGTGNEPPPVEPPVEEQPKVPSVTTSLAIDASTGYLHGLPAVPMAASDLLKAVTVTDGSAVLLDKDGNQVTGNVATGHTLRILDPAGATYKEYTVVIYGDATGDGKINSVDLLKIQKYILKLDTLDGPWLAAADGKRDGKINSVDLLKIQKSILKLDSLEQ